MNKENNLGTFTQQSFREFLMTCSSGLCRLIKWVHDCCCGVLSHNCGVWECFRGFGSAGGSLGILQGPGKVSWAAPGDFSTWVWVNSQNPGRSLSLLGGARTDLPRSLFPGKRAGGEVQTFRQQLGRFGEQLWGFFP